MACSKIENIINKFNGFTEKPVKYLTIQNELKDDIKSLVKSLYDYTKLQEKDGRAKTGALPELIIEGFDEEQLWQELELQNNECWDQLVWEVANCISLKNDLVFPVKTSDVKAKKVTNRDDKAKKVIDQEEMEPPSDDEEIVPKQSGNIKKKRQTPNSKAKPSVVDDQFFKLKDMEEFLLKEERNEGKKAPEDSDEESINFFEDIDDIDDDDDDDDDDEVDKAERIQNVMYNDFFDQENGDDNDDGQQDDEMDDYQSKLEGNIDDELGNEDDDIENQDLEKPNKTDKKVRFAQPSSSDDEDSDVNDVVADKKTADVSTEKKSEFEHRQERLRKQIDRLEENTLNEAPWQLKGEVDANKRPQNSLLEEVVDFDLTTRPAPIITEQTTLTLEDIIHQRIKDKAWDDVEKKEKPVDDQLSFRKTEVLDHAKSKLSLAQVYEAEYLKQKQTASGEVEDEKVPEEHTLIREAMSELFSKLDALCHYHYTPKAAQAEVKIVSNTPAISMEEVAPIATSDATLLAPEEVKKKQRGDLLAKEERTQTDKNRERRKKKKLQRTKGGQVTKVTEHRNTKKGVEANNTVLKTSKAFFQQLNDDATSLIKSRKNKNVKNNKGK